MRRALVAVLIAGASWAAAGARGSLGELTADMAPPEHAGRRERASQEIKSATDALEVPAGIFSQGVASLVVVDIAGNGRQRLWVHIGILEDVPYFQAEARWDKAAGVRGDAQQWTARVALPDGCGEAGLEALLRRLYARRPWPDATWVKQGASAAREAAVLANMWLLSDIAREACAAAATCDDLGLPSGGARLPAEVVDTMLRQALSDPSLLNHTGDVLDHQAESGAQHLDQLVYLLRGKAEANRILSFTRRLPRAVFEWSCRMASRQCERFPARIDIVVNTMSVTKADADLHMACLQSLLDQAVALVELGDVSADAYAAAILSLSSFEPVAPRHIAALGHSGALAVSKRMLTEPESVDRGAMKALTDKIASVHGGSIVDYEVRGIERRAWELRNT